MATGRQMLQSTFLFCGSHLLGEEKNSGKQYLRIGKHIQGSSPFSDYVLLQLLILGHISTAGK